MRDRVDVTAGLSSGDPDDDWYLIYKRLTTAGRKPVLTYSTNQLTQAGVIWICIISGDAGDAETTQQLGSEVKRETTK